MIEMTAATTCADCPHQRGMHYRSYDGEIVGCAACECDGFMLTPSKPAQPEPADAGLVEQGMTIFRLIAARKQAEAERDEARAQTREYAGTVYRQTKEIEALSAVATEARAQVEGLRGAIRPVIEVCDVLLEHSQSLAPGAAIIGVGQVQITPDDLIRLRAALAGGAEGEPAP